MARHTAVGQRPCIRAYDSWVRDLVSGHMTVGLETLCPGITLARLGTLSLVLGT